MVDNEEKTIEACITQIEELDKVLARFTVQENKERASHWRRGVEISWKAFRSLREDENLEGLQRCLDRLLSLMSLQLQTRMALKLDKISADFLRQLESLHLDGSSTPPVSEVAPLSIIPFNRNQDFVGRTELLDKIDRRFRSGQSRVALCRLGGVGKSQIAREYAFRLTEQSPETSAF